MPIQQPNIGVFSLADVLAKKQERQMNELKMQDFMRNQNQQQTLGDIFARSIDTTGATPAVPAQPYQEANSPESAFGLPELQGNIATAAIPGDPGRTDLNYNAALARAQSLPEAMRGPIVMQIHQARQAEEDRRMAMMLKMQQARGGDPFEGPVLFDTEGKTYRSTKDGRIMPVSVEGGATIAPPVYPYQFTPTSGGPPQQGVITKPQAARMAQGGPVSLGMTEAQGKQNIENRTKYVKNLSGLEKTESTLGALDKFLTEKGTQPGVGPINATDRRTAQTLHANVLAGLREIDDMGVLQPGELPFLERQIADPGSILNFGQAEAIRAQINTVRNRIARLKPILEKQYGQAEAQTNAWEDSQYQYRRLPDGTVQRKKK